MAAFGKVLLAPNSKIKIAHPCISEARKHSSSVEEGQESGEGIQSPSQHSCWNCGRKAHETCSGCSVARYCGPFCQHKDWENHHQVCTSRDKSRPQRTPSAGPTSAPASAPQISPAVDATRLKK